jgi:hypothetical protein
MPQLHDAARDQQTPIIAGRNNAGWSGPYLPAALADPSESPIRSPADLTRELNTSSLRPGQDCLADHQMHLDRMPRLKSKVGTSQVLDVRRGHQNLTCQVAGV